MASKDVTIMADIQAENESTAERVRNGLRSRGVYGVNVIGAPGAGFGEVCAWLRSRL